MLIMPILLADLKEIMTAIVPLVMLVFWIISQVFGQKEAQPKQGKPAGNPRPQADEGGLKAEIERFLQEAKQQQETKQKPNSDRELDTVADHQRQREREEREREERQRRKLEKKRRQQEQEREAARVRERESQRSHRHEEIEIIEDAQVVGAYPVAPKEIPPYEKNQRFIESASHLGEKIGQTDERLESHLHDVFDHQLGNFADSPDASIAKEAARKGDLVTIQEITDMLRTPANFRKAIIMKEILDRPESRWE